MILAAGTVPSLAVVGAACGGLAATQCGDNEWCSYPEGVECRKGGLTGSCVPIACAPTWDLHPVCGCDGKTYSNACDANLAGTGVAKEGKCNGG